MTLNAKTETKLRASIVDIRASEEQAIRTYDELNQVEKSLTLTNQETLSDVKGLLARNVRELLAFLRTFITSVSKVNEAIHAQAAEIYLPQLTEAAQRNIHSTRTEPLSLAPLD